MDTTRERIERVVTSHHNGTIGDLVNKIAIEYSTCRLEDPADRQTLAQHTLELFPGGYQRMRQYDALVTMSRANALIEDAFATGLAEWAYDRLLLEYDEPCLSSAFEALSNILSRASAPLLSPDLTRRIAHVALDAVDSGVTFEAYGTAFWALCRQNCPIDALERAVWCTDQNLILKAMEHPSAPEEMRVIAALRVPESRYFV